MIVLRFLKDYYPDIKEQCEALVNYPAEEPSLEEIDNAYRPISEMLNYKPEYLPEMLKKFIAFFRDVIKNQYDIDIVSTNG
jgi:pantothenate kinase